MKSRELLKLAVQILGLAFWYHGVLGLAGLASVLYAASQAQSFFLLVQGAFPSVVLIGAGFLCLRKADPIVGLAFRDDDGGRGI